MANDEFRGPTVVPTPTQAMHPTTKAYVDAAVAAGGGGTSTLRGATDYDNTTPPTDNQVIAWLASASKFRPLSITPGLIGAATTADLSARALDSAVVHNTGNETINGQKTVPSGAGNQWIFNIAPQIAVGTLANQPVRRDDARMTDARAWSLYTPGAEATGKVPTWNGTAYVATTPSSGGMSNLSSFGIYSVKSYGATGDGTTDDTAAIQAALNATPAGGVCWLPPGVYRTSSSLVLPPQVTLEGTHAPSLTYASSPANPCVIRPLAAGAWTGTAAVIRMLNKTTGGYASDSVGQRLRWLAIDGSGNTTPGMVGVQLYGFVREVVCDHVTVRNVTGDAFATVSFSPFSGDAAAPQSCNFLDCYADNCGAAGFVISGPDCLLMGCNAQGCGYVGYLIQFAPNTQLLGCRAEWAGNHNYYITGSYGTAQGAGSVLMSGCSSDRANFNGILIDSTGSGAHNIVGFSARRDGRNNNTGGGDYAAIQINGAANPVVIDGLTVYPGVNDDGAGTNSPQHGVRSTGAVYVSVASGYIHAATTAVTDNGGNTYFAVAPGVGRATGTTAAPTRTAPTAVVLTTDGRLSDARTPLAHGHSAADLTSGVLDYSRLPLSPLATKTAAYTCVDTDNVVLANTTSAAFTVTLPTAVGRSGKRFLIKKTGINQLTIATNGGTIDGLTSEIITITNGFREVVSDGTNWWVTGGKIDPVIAALANVGAGGTITINPAQASVYRVTTTGSTATLAAPVASADADVVNVEILANVATTITFASGILLTGGISATMAIPAGKRWFGALRYVTSVGWFMLASSVQN